MAQTTLNVRMDEDIKNNFESICEEIGISMSTAVIIFAKKMARERRIPFDVSADPFYDQSNIEYLRKIITGIETGQAALTEHGLIEVD